MEKGRPITHITIAFAQGQLQIGTNLSLASIRAAMKGDEKTGEITLPSIAEVQVKSHPKSEDVLYILTDEEVHFNVKDIVFWSVQVSKDAPKIQRVPTLIQ